MKFDKIKTSILDIWLQKKLISKYHNQNFIHNLKQEQWNLFKKTLKYAKKNSLFYKKHFSNIDLNNISKENISLIPFTSSKDLYNYEQFLCVSLSEIERIVSIPTSGTTGNPKRIAFSEEDLNSIKDFFYTGMSQLINANERLLVLWPGAHLSRGINALLSESLSKKNIRVFNGNPTVTNESIKNELLKYNPHVIIGAPSQLITLADTLENYSSSFFINGEKIALQAILSSGENLYPNFEDRFKSLGITHFDHYGMTESGYSIGLECSAKEGYHLRELDIFLEIIAINDIYPVPHGEYGEIVITTLNRQAMPLIRYRTGDVAKIISGQCPCGSSLQRLSYLSGRIKKQDKSYDIEKCYKGNFYERTHQATL